MLTLMGSTASFNITVDPPIKENDDWHLFKLGNETIWLRKEYCKYNTQENYVNIPIGLVCKHHLWDYT